MSLLHLLWGRTRTSSHCCSEFYLQWQHTVTKKSTYLYFIYTAQFYMVTLSCIYAPDKIFYQRTHNKSYTNIQIFFNIFNYSPCQWIVREIVILVENILLYEFEFHQRYSKKKIYSFQCTFWQQFDFVFSIIYLLQ